MARFPASVEPAQVQTNMVLVHTNAFSFAADEFVASLAREDVLVGDMSPGVLRFALHQDVDDRDVDKVLDVVDRLT